MIDRLLTTGHSTYDAIAIPKSLAAERASSPRATDLQVVYPEPTVWADYPFAVISADPDTAAAARAFRDFLRSAPQQRQALVAGLRPVAGGIALDDAVATNPFRSSPIGLSTAAPAAVETSAANVAALLDLWRKNLVR